MHLGFNLFLLWGTRKSIIPHFQPFLFHTFTHKLPVWDPVVVCARVCSYKKCNQTKSVKSSTVDTSLFLCPEASEFGAGVLCWNDLFCCVCPWVSEMPGVERDWISSWAWVRAERQQNGWNFWLSERGDSDEGELFLYTCVVLTLVLILLMCRNLASHFEA